MLYNENTSAERHGQAAPGRGIFVTIEGIDGSGKSTHVERLRTALENRGHTVLQLREPGGTAIGESIRQILLSRKNDGMTVEAELLLFEAARAQLVRDVIEPALAAGTIVLSDRFMDSTVAYQGYGRGMDLELIERLNAFAVGSCRPDLTILLDVETGEAARRVGKRAETDRMDGAGLAFMERTRSGYLAIAAREPERVRILSALPPKDELHAQIMAIIKEGFGV